MVDDEPEADDEPVDGEEYEEEEEDDEEEDLNPNLRDELGVYIHTAYACILQCNIPKRTDGHSNNNLHFYSTSVCNILQYLIYTNTLYTCTVLVFPFVDNSCINGVQCFYLLYL